MDRGLREHQDSTTTAFGALSKCVPRYHSPISHRSRQSRLRLCGYISHTFGSDGVVRRKAECPHFAGHNNKSQGGHMDRIPPRHLRHDTTYRRVVVLLAIAVALPLAIPAAHAGKYELIKGQGVEVCEAYKRNLNSFGSHWPMNCEREVDPEMAKLGLTKPEWHSLEPIKHFNLIVDIDKFLQPTAYKPALSKQQIADLRTQAKQKSVSLLLTDIDINNDGQPEPVLKFSYGCAPPGSGGWWATPIVVVDVSYQSLDRAKTLPLLQNESSDREKYPAGGWRYTMYDIFLFKGKTYFDRWSDSREDTGILRVFSTKIKRTTEICAYEYKYAGKQ